MTLPSVSTIILAAGKGTRMKSSTPKVLHHFLGEPIIEHVLRHVGGAGFKDICLVLGQEHADFKPLLTKHAEISVCIQNQQRGTGDAVAACSDFFAGHVKRPSFADGSMIQGSPSSAEYVLVCLGDVPALNSSILKDFLSESLEQEAVISVLGFEPPSPTGYGRLIQGEASQLIEIIEEKDTDEHTKLVTACNSGVIFAKTTLLFELLNKLTPNNSQGEYYLTDCVKLACQLDYRTYVKLAQPWQCFSGINTPEQLKELENWAKNSK